MNQESPGSATLKPGECQSSILAGMWAFSPDVNLSAADETVSIFPFWLVGDTELMVKEPQIRILLHYGNQIELDADGTFRKTN